MNRTFAVLVLVIVVALAGCTSLTNGDDNTPTDTNGEQNEESSGDNVVSYSSSGFSPETIRINEGETVTWVSEGPAMWVASDVHPTHTVYPDSSIQRCGSDEEDTIFDQCSAGNEYSFTFDEPGEWGYHNHRRAAHTGTVLVE